MRRLLKWLVILGVLAGGVAGISVPLQGWWHQRSLPKYLTTTITRGRVETTVNSTGTVKAVRTVSVGAFVSGPIAKINVDFNSRVIKDKTILAVIDERLLKAAADSAEAALENQKAELERVQALLKQAENNEARAHNLAAVNKDYLSDTEMDQYVFTRRTCRPRSN